MSVAEKVRNFFNTECSLTSPLSTEEIISKLSNNTAIETKRPKFEKYFTGPQFYGITTKNSFVIRGNTYQGRSFTKVTGMVVPDAIGSKINVQFSFSLASFLTLIAIVYIVVIFTTTGIEPYVLVPFVTICTLFGTHMMFGKEKNEAKKFLGRVADVTP